MLYEVITFYPVVCKVRKILHEQSALTCAYKIDIFSERLYSQAVKLLKKFCNVFFCPVKNCRMVERKYLPVCHGIFYFHQGFKPCAFVAVQMPE